MEITQVKVFPVYEDKLKAFVSIVFDHCFMVNDIKVIQGKDGLFLSMPSRRKRSGEFKDVAHPLNHETRRLIELRVLEEYRNMVDDHTPRRPDRVGDEPRDLDEAPEADRPADRAASGPAVPIRPFVPPERPAVRPSGRPDVAPLAAVAHAGRNGESAHAPGARADVRPGAAGAEPVPAAADSEPSSEPRTLEEVQEAHLSDSFWSVS